MNNLTFAPATFDGIKLKMSIQGVSGAGKTYTALAIASGLGKKVAVIDTERGKSALYSRKFKFDIMSLNDHHPNNYVKAIDMAIEAGYESLVIDSLSHSWMGLNGILEQVDKFAAMAKGNNMVGWNKATPMMKSMVDKILDANIHIISTLRAKKEYVLSKDERGKQKVEIVGMAAVHKEGLEFEFDLNTEMDLDHNLIIIKSRLLDLNDKVVNRPDMKYAANLAKALAGDIAERPEEAFVIDVATATEVLTEMKKEMKAPPAEPSPYLDEATYTKLYNDAIGFGHDKISLKNILGDLGLTTFKAIPKERFEEVREALLDPRRFDNIDEVM